MHILIVSTLSVISAGAQKSRSGIKAVPLLHLHSLPASEAQRATVSKLKHAGNSAAKSLVSFSGWQNSLVKSGVSLDGTYDGLESYFIHEQLSAVLALQLTSSLIM